MRSSFVNSASLFSLAIAGFVGCSSSGDNAAPVAEVQIKNDFNNPAITGFQPPWTICKASYQGGQFGKVEIGITSPVQQVPAGLDYVLMVASWNDPSCDPAHCLPLATKNKEEVVSGQARTIAVGMTNHQGPCPPEGVQPIAEDQYNRILQLWPEYNFKAYAQRAQNSQCSGNSTTTDGGTDGGTDDASIADATEQ